MISKELEQIRDDIENCLEQIEKDDVKLGTVAQSQIVTEILSNIIQSLTGLLIFLDFELYKNSKKEK